MDQRADPGLADEAVVQERPGVSMTEYRIVGELAAVFRAITGLFRQYNPMGYGTRVHEIAVGDGGQYAARVSRSNSCD